MSDTRHDDDDAPQPGPDDSATANNDPSSEHEPKRKRMPPAAGRAEKARPTSEQVTLRVASVARALVDGLGRAAILQAVANEQRNEALKRVKARQAGAIGDELGALVPNVWGDVAIPERTVEAYMAKAKRALGEEGTRVAKMRDYVLGIQLARYNETYQAAFTKGRYHTCLGVLRQIDHLFGMREAIRVMLMQGTADTNAEKERGSQHNLTSDEGRAAALAELVGKATTRDEKLRSVFARFAKLEDIPIVPTPATSTSGKPNGSKSNGHGNGKEKGNGKHHPH